MQTKVGIREFRENLAVYLESNKPVAITRHGATIGIYVPTPPPKPRKVDWEAVEKAAAKVQRAMAEAGVTEDELVEDFKRLRRANRGK